MAHLCNYSRRLLLGAVLLLSCSLGLVGCFRVHIPQFPHQIKLKPRTSTQALLLEFHPQDQAVVSDVLHASTQALLIAQRWGKLRHPLRIMVFPTHRSLEEAVMHRYRWLRAWAKFDSIYIQSPRTWRLRYYQIPLVELLTHELTHVVMYQLCCRRNNWRFKRIPLWFREGMASVNATQQYRRWSWQRLQAFRKSNKGRQLIRYPERFLKKEQSIAYSVAHWMFAYFLARFGDKGVRRLFSIMYAGASFQDAFRKVSGISPQRFQDKFLNRLKGPAPSKAVSFQVPKRFGSSDPSVFLAPLIDTHSPRTPAFSSSRLVQNSPRFVPLPLESSKRCW